MAVVVPTPSCPPNSDADVAIVALRSEPYPTLAAITLETGEGVAVYTAKEKDKRLNKNYYIDGKEYLRAEIRASASNILDTDYTLRSSETEENVADRGNTLVLVQFQRGTMLYSPLIGVRDAKIAYTAKNKTFHLWWTVYGFTSPDFHSDSPLNVAEHNCEGVESFNSADFFTVRQSDKTEQDLKCAAKVLLHAVGERVILTENAEEPTGQVYLVFNPPEVVAYWPLSCTSSSSSKSSSSRSSSSSSSSKSSSRSSSPSSLSMSSSRSSSSPSSSSTSSSSSSRSSSPSSKQSSPSSSSSKSSSSRSSSSKSTSSTSRSTRSRASISAECKSWITVYQFLDDISVSVGDVISSGAEIGVVGNSYMHFALAFEDGVNEFGVAVSTEDTIALAQFGVRAGGTTPVAPVGISDGNIQFAKDHTVFPMDPGGCSWFEQMGSVDHDGPTYWGRDILCSEEGQTLGQSVKNAGTGTGITHTVIRANNEDGVVVIRHTCPSSSRSSSSKTSSSQSKSSRSPSRSSSLSSSFSSSRSSSERSSPSLGSPVSRTSSPSPSLSKSRASKDSSASYSRSPSRSTSRYSSQSYSSKSQSSKSPSQSSASSCPKFSGCITVICDILWNEATCSLTIVRGKLTVEDGRICQDSGCTEEDSPCPTVMGFGTEVSPEDQPTYVEGAIFLEESKTPDAVRVMKTLLNLKEVTWKNVMVTGGMSDESIQILSQHDVKIHLIPQEVPGNRKTKIEDVARLIKRRTDLVVFVGNTGIEVPTDMITLEVAYKREGALSLGAATCTVATCTDARLGLQEDVKKNTRVIRLGEEPEALIPSEERTLARKSLGLKDEKVIVYVGDNVQRWTRLNRLKRSILQQTQLGWAKGSETGGWALLDKRNLPIQRTVDFLNLADLVVIEDSASTEAAKAMAWVNRIPVIVLGDPPKDQTKDLAEYLDGDKDEELLKAIERGLRSVDRVQKASRYVWENLTQKGAERKWSNLLEQLIPVFLRK